jgi:transcriptional regulator with XRE-family HTH domain
MNHSLVSRLEGGQRTPTRDSLAKLCAGLGLGREDADRLGLASGFPPADLPPEDLRSALTLVRSASPGEIAATGGVR